MPDLDSTEDRLEQLQRRWDQDRSSRVFVQLAEEYRRRGDYASALEVLEAGLGAHPKYVSAQVALGRVQLELGRLDEAREVFERVTTQDPTHLLALKLLVESRLRLQDPKGALEALERYRLLGAPAEELEELEGWLSRGEQAAAAEGSEAATTALEPEIEPAEPGRERPIEVAAGNVSGEGERGGFAAGQVFRLQPLAPRPLRLPGWQSPRPRRFAASAGDAAVEIPPPFRLRVVADEVFSLWAVESVEQSARPVAQEPGAIAEEGPEETIPDQEATATLGEIYLQQGHLEEAERIFRRVLANEPAHRAAGAGLEAIALRRQRPLDADTLLGADGRDVRGITARKILVLGRYLDRLRSGAAKGRP